MMNELFRCAKTCSIDIIPNAGTLLVIAPHPDDESLGCGGTIVQAVNAGLDVEVIFVTDGSRSHPDSKEYPFKKLVATREKEAITALSTLGVEEQSIHFMRLPDGQLPSVSGPKFDEYSSLMNDLLTAIQPSAIFLPWRRDPHKDHRATWEIVISALKLTDLNPELFEYFIWLLERASIEDMPKEHEGKIFYIDISAELEIKTKAILAHISQTTALINDDDNGFTLSPEMLDHFKNFKEYFIRTTETMANNDQTLSENYFDEIYHHKKDPWDLATSSYERDKYDTTVAALPNPSYESALEIGCSIGVLTETLLQKCHNILAIDIADAPVAQAKLRLKNYPQARVEKMSVPTFFPEESFDLIVMSEVGYFFSIHDLDTLHYRIIENLNSGGQLLLVHWTPFVPDFPLTGDQVHDFFLDRSGTGQPFKHLTNFRAEQYRLDLFQKS